MIKRCEQISSYISAVHKHGSKMATVYKINGTCTVDCAMWTLRHCWLQNGGGCHWADYKFIQNQFQTQKKKTQITQWFVLRIERQQPGQICNDTYASSKSQLIYINLEVFAAPNMFHKGSVAIVVFPNYFSLYSSFITRLIFFLCLPNQTESAGNQSINQYTYIHV